MDAVELIEEAALEPTLDELARRSRATLATKEPSEGEMLDLVTFFRRDRAAWEGRKTTKENKDA